MSGVSISTGISGMSGVTSITMVAIESSGVSSNSLNLGGGLNSVDDGLSDSVDNGLGDVLGHSPGLVQGLGVGGLGLHDGLVLEDGLVLNDGLGDVLGGDDLAGDDLGDGGGLVDDGRLGDGVSHGGQLRGDFGVGVGLGHGEGKVAAQAVVLDAGRVVGGGPDQSGGQVQGRSEHGLLRTAGGHSQKGGENDESVHDAIRDKVEQAM